LQELIGFGGPMRTTIAEALLNRDLYRRLCYGPFSIPSLHLSRFLQLRVKEEWDLEGDETRTNVSLDWRSLPKLRYALSTLAVIAAPNEDSHAMGEWLPVAAAALPPHSVSPS
jgi:hypothetical protein